MIISVLTAMILLFGVHCIADYPFQPDFLVKYKRTSYYILACHCAIYTLVVTVGLFVTSIFMGLDIHNWFWIVIAIFLSHTIIDKWRCTHGEDPENDDDVIRSYFYVDQSLHMLVIYAAFFCLLM